MNLMKSLNSIERCESPAQCESPSVVDTLSRKQKSLQRQLDDVNAALDALRSNPEVTKVLELIARCNY